MLIINADDMGINEKCTDRVMEAYDRHAITSATALVFMQDTARAADLALSRNMGIGLHLNFTAPFSSPPENRNVYKHHQKLIDFFTSWRYSKYLYNPTIRESILYCLHLQYDEFLRVFGKHPTHIDGHHHMHLATNVLFGRVFQDGIKIRKITDIIPQRNLLDSFYRNSIGSYIKRRFITTDLFYPLNPFIGTYPEQKILMGRTRNVEIMIHVEEEDQWSYVNSDDYLQMIDLSSKGSYLDLNANPASCC